MYNYITIQLTDMMKMIILFISIILIILQNAVPTRLTELFKYRLCFHIKLKPRLIFSSAPEQPSEHWAVQASCKH